jgi:hypothetical protein
MRRRESYNAKSVSVRLDSLGYEGMGSLFDMSKWGKMRKPIP